MKQQEERDISNSAKIEKVPYQNLYNLLMQAPAAICLLRGPQHIYELANRRYLEIVGHRDLLEKPIREALPELANQGIFEILDQVYTTGEPFIGNEVRVDLERLPKGELQETYFNFVYQPTRNLAGNIDGVFVHAVDVTEQVHARQKSQESEARLQRLVDSNIIGVSFTNRNGAIIDANDHFLRMMGYTREELITNNLNWRRMTPPEYATLDREALEEIERDGAVSHPYAKDYISKNGKRIPVLAGGASIDKARGEIVTFVIDMRQQKQMEEEIRRGKDQLEIILQNVANGITVHDRQGNILYTNDVAAKMIGFSSAQAMLNASFEGYQQILNRFIVKDEEGKLISTDDFPGRRALREKRTVRVLFEYTDTLTGHTNWSLVKSQPIINEDGQAQLVVNVMTDISEQQALEQRKNEFISMASHELKTPVTALKGFANLLQRRSKRQEDQQALHYLSRMDGQLNKLANLINDLLDLSKIQAGNFALQEETIDLTALIDEIIENIQGTTSTHSIHFTETEPLYIKGDKDRLGQVLINLLTNAIKYSPGASTVIVRATTDEAQVTVSVQDFGIGITEIHQQHVFERFYQVTDPQEKTYPGLGIGLYIAHDIIKRHHGTMWVESSKGKGATFFFTVSRARESIYIEDH
jgi:PAS domain S-box-containing protein